MITKKTTYSITDEELPVLSNQIVSTLASELKDGLFIAVFTDKISIHQLSGILNVNASALSKHIQARPDKLKNIGTAKKIMYPTKVVKRLLEEGFFNPIL